MFLLRTGGQSVTDVCLADGFSSPGTVSRTSRDVTGTSPTQFRRAHAPLLAPT